MKKCCELAIQDRVENCGYLREFDPVAIAETAAKYWAADAHLRYCAALREAGEI